MSAHHGPEIVTVRHPSLRASDHPFLDAVDLAAERLGGSALWASDDFFAEKDNLLKAAYPVFIDGKYTDRGKWMDGWESRRKRTEGEITPYDGDPDVCIVRLGLPGVVRGVVVDTAFFRGNFPESCALEGCFARVDATVSELLSAETTWVPLLPRTVLAGDSENPFVVEARVVCTHVRLRIFPDGGVARLRVFGDVAPDWRRLGGGANELDLASLELGAQVVAASDMFFGSRHNLIQPGRSANMGDGWETRRRRTPGHDWVVVRLAGEGEIRRIEVDTNHFKGNFPDMCSIDVAHGAPDADVTTLAFEPILPRTKLSAHTRHFFVDELAKTGPVTHVRLNIHPDGGISRLRVHGALTEGARIALGLARLDTLPETLARAQLHMCLGSTTWVDAMMAARPFVDAPTLEAAAAKAFTKVTSAEWLDTFKTHPRLGEKRAATPQSATERAWSAGEQAGVSGAADEVRVRLAAGNRAYEERFGHIFLLCAQGKRADEILAALEARLGNTPEAEVLVAAGELRAIALLRLEKLLLV